MNWSKTKSIFIICFLLLDAFLIFTLYQQQDAESIGEPVDGQRPSESNVIPANTDIPATPDNVTFLQGTMTNFTSEQEELERTLNASDQIPKQEVLIEEEGKTLYGVFEQPIAAPENNTIRNQLLQSVYNGIQYVYWDTDPKEGTINFVQTYEDRPVYLGKQSNIPMLSFILDDQQVTGYRQGFFKFEQSNKVNIINADRAINNLRTSNTVSLAENPKIEKVELSYINMVGNTVGDATSDFLIFVPAWHIVVKTDSGNSEYFVNAVSGVVQTLE